MIFDNTNDMKIFRRKNPNGGYYPQWCIWLEGQLFGLDTEDYEIAKVRAKEAQTANSNKRRIDLKARVERRCHFVADQYLEWCAARHKYYTVKNKRWILKRFKEYFKKNPPIDYITENDLDDYTVWLLQQGLEPRSVADVLRGTKPLFKWARRNRYLTQNPCYDWHPPTIPNKPKDYYTTEELKRLILASQSHHYMKYLIPIQCYTSAGMAEVCNEIIFQEDVLWMYRTKTENLYPVPIVPRLKHYIKDIPLGKKKIYPCKWKSEYEKQFKKIKKAAGLEYIKTHGIRRSVAQFLHEQGVPDIVIAKIMGHRDDGKTARQNYTQVTLDMIKKEMDKLPL